jgi:WD40 repeat protein/serine/threonine protein kinase
MKPSETGLGSVERQLFVLAVEKPPGKERAAFLDGACATNPALRRRLELLLEKFESLGTFLEEPAVSARNPLPGPSAPELLGKTVAAGSRPSHDHRRATDPPSLVTRQLSHEKPGDRIGRYKILQMIGEGGCGVVYMAEQEEPVRRRVALKVIKLGMDTRQVIARFEAERQALAMMDHPNIAKVLDAGATEAGRPYFVMELVRGIKITDYCDQNNLTTRQRLDLFIPICQAIQHAHQKGIIHRDIKPSNILVTLHDGLPVPKVIDFGIAKATEGRLTDQTLFTAFEQFIGTPAYMSPEQAEMSGLDIDTRSDIYSLGVLLYELLTGRTPLDTKELLEVGLDELRRTIRERDPMRPSTRLRSLVEEEKTTAAKRRGVDVPKLIHLLSGDLDWIVMKCLEKDRTRRYETANGLAMDIQRHLQNEPVVARPPSRLYKIQKLARRNKMAFAATAAVTVALVLGTVVSIWQAVRAEHARLQAQANEQKALVAKKSEEKERKIADQNAARALKAETAANENLTNATRNLYVVQMNLAQQYWDEGNIQGVRELLKATETYPDRGFEWYYWQRQTHLELRTLRGHTDSVLGVAFSPDGQWIATSSADRTVQLWETATGRQVRVLVGHSAGVSGVAFSPDGRQLVTGSTDQTARIWDAASGKEIRILVGHLDEVYSVAYSKDGRRILTGSRDRTARIWDATSGEQIVELQGHNRGVTRASFSPDDKRIVTASLDGTVRVWDSATGTNLLTSTESTPDIWFAVFSPDGHRILAGGKSDAVRILDASSAKDLTPLKSLGNPYCIAFSHDGKRMLIGNHGHKPAVLFDAESGNELFAFKGHSGEINAMAFSPDGALIITASDDHTVKIWDASHGTETPTLHGHTSWIWSLVLSPDGKRVLTGSFDHTAKLWDAITGRELVTLPPRDIGRILGVAYSADGRLVAIHSDHTACVYETENWKELVSRRQTNGVGWLAFAPNGQLMVCAWRELRAWDPVTGRDLGVVFKGTPDPMGAISPDQRLLVTVDPHRTRTKVWEVSSGKELLTLTGAQPGPFDLMNFSPDSRRIAAAGPDGTCVLWNAANGEEIFRLRGQAGIASVAFTLDERRIITGGYSSTAKVWESATGKALLTLKGHTAAVQSLAVSSDGQRIVTGSLDNSIKIWEAATKEQVAAWEKEKGAAEKPADQRVALNATSPQTNDTVIRTWLVLAPIAFQGPEVLETDLPGASSNTVTTLDREEIPGEAHLAPRAGETVQMDGAVRTWTEYKSDDGELNFNQFVGTMSEWSVGYAVGYIQSAYDRTDVVMKVVRDDYAKIYLNGREIYRREDGGPADESHPDTASGVHLSAGNNTLVFKVANEEGGWFGSVRFTDEMGQPLKGVRATLTPPPLSQPLKR